jgi:hypothetical protein
VREGTECALFLWHCEKSIEDWKNALIITWIPPLDRLGVVNADSAALFEFIYFVLFVKFNFLRAFEFPVFAQSAHTLL